MSVLQVAHKIDRAERELKNLDLKVSPKSMQVAKKQVSEEEMYTLRKIGLRMKPFLLLGKILSLVISCMILFIFILLQVISTCR